MEDLCSEINKLGKSIGSPARYRILEALIKGRKTVSELVSILHTSQPAVSQHLKTLKTSNLVIDERRGQEIFYSINSEYMLKLLTSLSNQVKKRPV
jgi:ArsR family transcriptional regulator